MNDIPIEKYIDTLFAQYKEAHEKEHRLIEKSVDSAKEALDVRLDHMNEFRSQIQDERNEYIGRERFNSVVENLAVRVGNLEVALSNLTGRVLGIGSAITVLLVIIELVLRFAVK